VKAADPLETPSFILKLIARSLHKMGEADLKSIGLSMAALPVLIAIKNNTESTQAKIARLLGIEQPSVAQMLARLERDGLIERTSCPANKRKSLIELTSSAKTLLESSKTVFNQGNNKAMQGFSENEIELFTSFLKRVQENLSENSLIKK